MKDNTLLKNRYCIKGKIGSGGMAHVYLAEDIILKRNVAIKIIREDLAKNQAHLDQFRQEIYAASNLMHSNIVVVYDIGVFKNRCFLVLEYVEGLTLKNIIAEYKKKGEFMPIKRMLNIALQICSGIEYAHQTGIIHCDIKPLNVLITTNDHVKITDFGISCLINSKKPLINQHVWGTPQYLSPEQISCKPILPSTDVYSIGILMYEMLSNRTPFQDKNPTILANKHLRELPPPIKVFNENIDDPIPQILQTMLSKEPSKRFRTVKQLNRILETHIVV